MIDIYEFIDYKLVTEINFIELRISENESLIEIELTDENDLEILKALLLDEFSSDEYKLIINKSNSLLIEIKFNDSIKYIDESEYIENIKSEISYYESLIDESEILSDLEIYENINEY